MSFRKIISDGDLVTLNKPWYSLLFGGKWEHHRNLSEEVRLLGEHVEAAKAKFIELQRLHVVAKKNVGDDLETLQILLLDNSEAFFESSIDSSILEEREGVKYNFGNHGNNKKGNSSSNNGSGEQKQQQQKKQQGKKYTALDLLTKAEFTLH